MTETGELPDRHYPFVEEKDQEAGRQPIEERFRMLVTATSSIVYHTDGKGEPLSENTSWYRFTGQTLEDVRNGGWIEAVHPDDRSTVNEAVSRSLAERTPYQVENRLRRIDGEWRHVVVRGIPIFDADGIVSEWIAYGHDITERKQREERLLQEAILDPLTQLYNRRFCDHGLPREISRAERSGDALVAIVFDLNGFKLVNDRFGHSAGDYVLKEFARRLSRSIRGSDFALRFGGDEFLVVLSGCPPEKVQVVLDRVIAFETEYDGNKIGVSSSYGWAQHKSGERAEELIRRADVALYANKQANGTSR